MFEYDLQVIFYYVYTIHWKMYANLQ